MDLSAPLNASNGYRQLVQQISDTYTQGRVQAMRAVNAQLMQTYWQVGRHIVEFEQAGQVRAEYGKALIGILRCFVLIDLKLGEVQHHDIGQMNLYLGYFANEENVEGDNPPVGIILSRQKDELLVEYETYGMSSQLFVQKYQLYLPDREALRRALEETLREAGQ